MNNPITTSRYAAAAATVALVAATGGTSYAAVQAKIGSSQIKANAIKSVHVADGSLLAADFKAGQLPAGPAGPQGAQGPQGPQGPQGAQGPAGPASLPAIDYNTSGAFPVANGATEYGSLNCDAGKRVVGGGVSTSAYGMSLDSSFPSGSTAWGAYVRNNSGTSANFYVYVICTSASAVSRPAPVAAK